MVYSILANDDPLGISSLFAGTSFYQEDTSYVDDVHTWQIGVFNGGTERYAGSDLVYNELFSPGHYSGSLDVTQEHGNSSWFDGPSFGNYFSHDKVDQIHFGWAGGNGWTELNSTQSHDQFNFNEWF